MIIVNMKGKNYRKGVGMVIVNRKGQFFLGKRIGADAWRSRAAPCIKPAKHLEP